MAPPEALAKRLRRPREESALSLCRCARPEGRLGSASSATVEGTASPGGAPARRRRPAAGRLELATHTHARARARVCVSPTRGDRRRGGGGAQVRRRATLCLPLSQMRLILVGLRAERTGRGRELILHGASGAVWLGPRAAPPRPPPTLGPLVLRRCACGLERLLRGGRAAAARAFPAWEWMGDARGGAKRADPKGGALNHAWVPTENTRSNVSVSV